MIGYFEYNKQNNMLFVQHYIFYKTYQITEETIINKNRY